MVTWLRWGGGSCLDAAHAAVGRVHVCPELPGAGQDGQGALHAGLEVVLHIAPELPTPGNICNKAKIQSIDALIKL